MRRLLALFLLLGLVGCVETSTEPGDFSLGQFQFVLGTDVGVDCPFVDGGLAPMRNFSASITVRASDRAAFLSTGHGRMGGGLDGGWLTVTGQGARDLPAPCSCPGTVEETFSGLLVPGGGGIGDCDTIPEEDIPTFGIDWNGDAGPRIPNYALLCRGEIVDRFVPDPDLCSADAGCPMEGCSVQRSVTGFRR